jgi:hypothetical protein
MIDVVVWDFVCPGSCASRLATLLLVPILDIQGHNLSSYQVSFPFVNSYLDQDFSGILQNQLMFSHLRFRDRIISEYSKSAMLNFECIIYQMPIYL